VFFFFSSRRRHTRFSRDWSSDVCSSDLDFSCGSAATATLLTYQYGHPVTELEVFRQMYAQGDQARIRKEGFSLLDMRRYLQSQRSEERRVGKEWRSGWSRGE